MCNDAGESDGRLNELQEILLAELESLAAPCHIEFTADVLLLPTSTDDATPRKKRRGRGEQTEYDLEAVWLEVNWIQGEKTLLHQLMQYLQNNMCSQNFQ